MCDFERAVNVFNVMYIVMMLWVLFGSSTDAMRGATLYDYFKDLVRFRAKMLDLTLHFCKL